MPKVPPQLIERLKHPLVVAGAIKLGVSLGQEAGRLRRGEVTLRQFKASMGRHVGGMTGTATGVALGAWAGSVVPGVGTVLGAFGGGLAGSMLGEMVTVESADRLRPEEADATSEKRPHGDPNTGAPNTDAENDEAAVPADEDAA